MEKLKKLENRIAAVAKRYGWKNCFRQIAGTGSCYLVYEKGGALVEVRIADHERKYFKSGAHVYITVTDELESLKKLLQQNPADILAEYRREISEARAERVAEKKRRAARAKMRPVMRWLRRLGAEVYQITDVRLSVNLGGGRSYIDLTSSTLRYSGVEEKK